MTVDKINTLIDSAKSKISQKTSLIDRKRNQIKKKQSFLVESGFSINPDWHEVFEKDPHI